MEHTEVDLQGEKPLLNIQGDKVALGPLQSSMISSFLQWQNDFAVSVMSGAPLRPVSREQTAEQFERYVKKDLDATSVEFAIYERASLQVIGLAKLTRIDKRQRTAEYTIVIGDKSCWGRGYGTETTLLILDYAFTVLGLHNILLHAASYNERAIRAYTRAGFRVMGRRREAARLGDQVYDVIYMDCLASEFRSPLKRIIELP